MMFRKLFSGFLTACLFVATSWAADPFLGTWAFNKDKLPPEAREQLKNMPPGTFGETLKVESYRAGYKLTLTQNITLGKTRQTHEFITIVDFKAGVSPVHNGQGEEIDRMKMVRISPTEIEATSLNYGGTLNYRIIDGGNGVEVRMFERKGDKPFLTGYYKRVQ
jgi:hypothetical protein